MLRDPRTTDLEPADRPRRSAADHAGRRRPGPPLVGQLRPVLAGLAPRPPAGSGAVGVRAQVALSMCSQGPSEWLDN